MESWKSSIRVGLVFTFSTVSRLKPKQALAKSREKPWKLKVLFRRADWVGDGSEMVYTTPHSICSDEIGGGFFFLSNKVVR
jgi:hypothetical protein